MSKAKTASKNNPKSRTKAKEFFYEGKKIRPTKLITELSCFMAAEYEDTDELVLDENGKPLSWKMSILKG